MPHKIILFDDNAKIRNALTLMINGYDDFLLEHSYPDYSNLIERITESGADMVIMDIELPPNDGIEAVGIIRKNFKDLPVLMFTVFEDDDKIFRSICAGAQGYLLKSASPTEIVDALKELAEGGGPMTPSIARKILNKFSEEIKITDTSSKNDEFKLTGREIEVLGLLKDGNTYLAITDLLNISYGTVRKHVNNIYTKLHVASKQQAIQKALKNNLFNK